MAPLKFFKATYKIPEQEKDNMILIDILIFSNKISSNYDFFVGGVKVAFKNPIRWKWMVNFTKDSYSGPNLYFSVDEEK